MAGLLETMPQEPWHPEKGAKLDHAIQLNSANVHTFNKRTELQQPKGTKMILSDKLWLIANNSKIFVNGSKSLKRNNLGLATALKFTLFRTFRNIFMDLMV